MILFCTELDAAKKQAEADKKAIEDLVRERDILNKVWNFFLSQTKLLAVWVFAQFCFLGQIKERGSAHSVSLSLFLSLSVCLSLSDARFQENKNQRALYIILGQVINPNQLCSEISSVCINCYRGC